MKINNPKIKEKVVVQALKKKSKKNSVRRRGFNSPYYLSLMAPWKVQGVKIPDEITCPSFTLQREERVALQQVIDSTSVDVTGIAVVLGGYNTSKDYYVITGSSAGALTWTPSNGATQSTLVAVASALRVVSAGLTITSEATDNNDAGRFICAFIPGGSNAITFSTGSSQWTIPTTIASLLNLPYVTTVPVSKGFAEVKYIPSDPQALAYVPPSIVPQRSPGATPVYGILIIAADGLTKGAGISFEATIFENAEALPAKSNTSLTDVEASFSDPIELAMVNNTLATQPEFPVTQSVDDTLAGSAENWIPQSLLPPTKRSFGKKSSLSLNRNSSSLSPLLAGAVGYSVAKSGALDKVPILGGILKTLGGLS